MPIPHDHKDRFFYHFTHVDNLPGILRNGFNSPNEQKRLDLDHTSIANQEIQERRARTEVPCGPGGVVHDYVPFYLCKLSSMLLTVVKSKNVDQQLLIYFALPISLIERPDVVFTNASANTGSPPQFFSEASHLSELNWSAIDSPKWVLDSDAEKQARMSEVLIHQTVDIRLVDHIIVWDAYIQMRVQQIYNESGLAAPPVRVRPDRYYYYFTQFWLPGPPQSLATGPQFTRRAFEDSVRVILEAGQSPDARFANLGDLLDALRADMSNLPETAELIGLESENIVHRETVGEHTLSVVRELTGSGEFAVLSEDDKRTVELAAFLHDIGKGPKSRWVRSGGKQKADANHPIRSVEMLVRILTEDVRAADPEEVRTLSKLICYHDLVGDILAEDRGRNPEQLEDITESERELSMLIGLGLADMRAITPNWYNDNIAKVPKLRERVLRKLNSGSA